MTRALLLLALAAAPAAAAPIPGSGCVTCIQNSAAPQNAQANVGTWTVRGTLSASTITVANLYVTTASFANITGNGSGLTGLNASAMASGTVPEARLSGSYTGIAAVGTLGTGVWQATAIGTQYGGTGQNWVAVGQGSLPYFGGTGSMSTLSPSTAGRLLQTGGAGANPSWTAAPTVLGTNITAIPLANLQTGSLPAGITVADANITGVAGTKVAGNITGKASNITDDLLVSQISSGTLAADNPASSITVTGVTPGTYGDSARTVQLVVRSDGRLDTATQFLISLPLSQLNAGTLGTTVLVPAASIQTGTLGALVRCSSLTATGVATGSFGDASRTVTAVVGIDGRLSALSQQNILITPSQISGGSLGTGITIPAAGVEAGALGPGVVCSSLSATGVVAGTYGSTNNSAQITVNAQGRVTSATQFQIPGVSTSVAYVNAFNDWIAAQTSKSSWTILNIMRANDIVAVYGVVATTVTASGVITASNFVGSSLGLSGIPSTASLVAQWTPIGFATAALSNSTSSLQGQIDGLVLSTGNFVAVAISTAYLQAQVNSLNATTATIAASTASLQSLLASVGFSTAGLQAQVDSLNVATAAVAASTASLQNQLTDVGASTASKVNRTGDYMTGGLNLPVSSMTAQAVIAGQITSTGSVTAATMTVQGNSFSVGGTTLVVQNGVVTIGSAFFSDDSLLHISGQGGPGTPVYFTTMHNHHGEANDLFGIKFSNLGFPGYAQIVSELNAGGGSSNLYIGTGGANTIRIGGNSVGINKDPTQMLDVSGAMRADGATISNNLTAATITVVGNAFSVGSSTLAVLGGRVGVGTSNPGAMLDVAGVAHFGTGPIQSTVSVDGSFTASQTSITANAFYDRNGLVGSGSSFDSNMSSMTRNDWDADVTATNWLGFATMTITVPANGELYAGITGVTAGLSLSADCNITIFSVKAGDAFACNWASIGGCTDGSNDSMGGANAATANDTITPWTPSPFIPTPSTSYQVYVGVRVSGNECRLTNMAGPRPKFTVLVRSSS